MNADGSGQTRLTNNPATDGDPAWSPDGTKIAFVSDRDGNLEIYVMNADGSGQTRLTNNPRPTTAARLVADGTEDRLRERPRRQLRDLRDERRRLRPDAADE